MSSNFLQVRKSIHVKTINDTSSNKRERFPKHSGSQKLFFTILLILNELFNPDSAVPDTSIKTVAECFGFDAIIFFENKKGTES